MATPPKKRTKADAEAAGLPLEPDAQPSAVMVAESVEVSGLWYGPGTYRDLAEDVVSALLESGKAAAV